jgi:uncharacterized caspase-like protein
MPALRTLLVVLAAFVPLLCDAADAHAEETRVALVIGNGNYVGVPPLSNPARDSAAVARTLQSLGFKTVQAELDLKFDAMRRVLRDFTALADKADWALVYYAGHGVEVDGVNYLIPVDARLRTDKDVTFEATPLDQVLLSIEGARKLRLVILDACRDNPFLRQMTRAITTRSISRGLARVEPEGGTLIVYAAKAGQVAYDGDGETSPFVTSLIRRMTEPGVEINKLFRLVRDDVLNATGKRQEPFVYGSLPGEDFFFRSVASVDPAATAPPGTSPLIQAPAAVTAPASTPSPSVRPARPARRPEPSKRVAAPKKMVVEQPRREPTARRPATSAGPSRGCFTFNGRNFCE